jgi:hypothetical protein
MNVEDYTVEQIQYMAKEADLMQACRIAGIDNWDGFSDALDIYEQEFKVD